jgi:hypothetical protein
VLGLIFSALRARRVQALVMVVLGALTVAAAVAAGWALDAADRAATRARIDGATAEQRTLSVRGTVVLGTDPAGTMGRFRGLIDTGSVERSVVGARLIGMIRNGERRQPVELRALDDFCANVKLEQGRCVGQDGEVVVGADLAQLLGVRVGDKILHEASLTATPVELTLVGLFEPVDPAGWYWAGQSGVAAFTTLPTVARAGGSVSVSATFDAVLKRAAFDDAEALNAGIARLRAGPLEVYSGAPALAADVAADRRATRRGIQVGELQVLLFGALAVAVAAAYAAQERRADAARLAIRGLPRWRIVVATASQSLLPLALGAIWSPWLFAAGAAIVIAADWSATQKRVPELLRVVQPRRPLAAATAEVCALVLAGAALFQVAAEPAADVRRDHGFGLSQVAPLLLAVGAGVLATRVLLAAAGLAGRNALAAGKLTGALAGLTLGRRRTAYRIVPLLAAATCVLALAAQDWAGAATAREQRATVELGADRVLRIAPVARERLLASVRAADPDGHDAMAAVVMGATGASPVIAVDSPRLKAVAGVDGAGLRGAAPQPLVFAGTGLTLTASGAGSKIRFVLSVTGTGEEVVAEFGPVTAETELTASVPACARGCRIDALEADHGPVELRGLAAGGKTVVDGRVFADPARWRTTLAQAASGIQVIQRDDRLRLVDVLPLTDRSIDSRLYVIDTPVPLPALVAGGLAGSDDHDQPAARIFGVSVPLVPRPVATVPRGGTAGVLVDLEYAQRIAAAAHGTEPAVDRAEVWLSGTAGDRVVDRLRAAGLNVIGSDTIAAAIGRAGRLAPALTLLAGLAAGGIVLLLGAVAAAVVAAVDRRQRDAELRNLRGQGVTQRTVRKVDRWSAVAPVLVAVPVGLLAAVVLRLLAPSPVRPFTDRWPVTQPAVQPLALLAAALAALLVFGAVALLGKRGAK